MRALIGFGVVVVVGCGYDPGSFADYRGRWTGTVQTIGCIDLAVDAGQDSKVADPIVAYGFGNRCAHPVTLDLATIRVVGRDVGGGEHTLVAYDPRNEIRAAPLDAMFAGREKISYVPKDPAPETPIAFVSICVEVGGIDASREHTERWVCTGRQP